MAHVRCPGCGGYVEHTVIACPACGCLAPGRRLVFGAVLIGMLVAVLTVVVIAVSTGGSAILEFLVEAGARDARDERRFEKKLIADGVIPDETKPGTDRRD